MNRRIILIVSMLSAVVAAAVLAASGVLGGGSGAAPRDTISDDGPIADAPMSASHAGDSSGLGEGIGVKGQWELTVLNADGSVAATHAVHNALQVGGRFALARLLSGDSVLPRQVDDPAWQLSLGLQEGSFVGQCDPGSIRSTTGQCTPAENSVYFQFADVARDSASVVLTIETEEFAGSAVVERVESRIVECTSAATGFPDASACEVDSTQTFTGTDITPVDIAEGQRIHVTVTLSFTTG